MSNALKEEGNYLMGQGQTDSNTLARTSESDKDFLRFILEESLNEIFLFDAETLKFVLVNRGARDNIGYSMEELSNLTPVDIKPLFNEEQFAEIMEPLRAGELDKLVFETVHQRKDRTRYPVEVHLQLTSFANREVYCAVILDTSKQESTKKELHNALQELEEQKDLLFRRNEAFVSALGEIVYEHDYETGVITWGGAISEKLAYSENQMGSSQEDWIKKIHPDDVTEVLSSIERARLESGSLDITYRVRHANGEYLWVNEVAVLTFAECKSIKNITGIIRDITARKREEERFRQVLQSAPDAMIIVDKKGQIDLLNSQALEVFGYGEGELQGKPIELLMPQRYRNAHLSHRENFFNKPALRPMGQGLELFGRRKNGEEFPLEISLSPIETPAGPVVAAGIRDITPRKEAEEKQQMLMAELDHRVKNILNVVLSIAQQMLRRSNTLETFKAGFLGRLMALAEVHRLLTSSKWEGVSLKKLGELATKPHISEQGPWAKISGEDVTLTPKFAQAAYLALHELATNATKYGALSVPEGIIELSWELGSSEVERNLLIKWIEKNGPEVKLPSETGFGSRLLERTISYELGGQTQIDYPSTGLECSISIPLPTNLGDRQ